MPVHSWIWYNVMVNIGRFLLESFLFNKIKKCDNIKRCWGFRFHFFPQKKCVTYFSLCLYANKAHVKAWQKTEFQKCQDFQEEGHSLALWRKERI